MKKNFSIKNKQAYIIAEIGLNHDGNFNKTFSLIKSAKRAGADAVKFQLFKAQDLYLENSKNFKLLKKLELSFSKIHKLRKFSKKLNIDFICTPFSIEAAAFLKKIKVDAIRRIRHLKSFCLKRQKRRIQICLPWLCSESTLVNLPRSSLC